MEIHFELSVWTVYLIGGVLDCSIDENVEAGGDENRGGETNEKHEHQVDPDELFADWWTVKLLLFALLKEVFCIEGLNS